jgi:hypothetical protein
MQLATFRGDARVGTYLMFKEATTGISKNEIYEIIKFNRGKHSLVIRSVDYAVGYTISKELLEKNGMMYVIQRGQNFIFYGAPCITNKLSNKRSLINVEYQLEGESLIRQVLLSQFLNDAEGYF